MESRKTDHIPELSPHYSETHSDDQLGGNTYRIDPLLELELAKVRLAQTEKEIELERLRQKGREHYDQVMVDKAMTYESTSVVDVPPRKDWVTMMSRALDLPKKEIIRFDGNPMNYWSFIRNFQDCFDESIGFRSRLNYLIQYCDGEAKNTIVHCALLEPEEGYRKALELLEEAFGQKHIVAHAFIDKMLNIPAIKGTDPYNLRRLSREMHICELTLTQMNYVSDLNSTKTIECMFLKLPLYLQREWVKVACRILKTGREPSFKDLCEFVKEQSDIANTRYGLLVNHGSNSGNKDVGVLKRKINTDYNAARISYASASDDNALLRSSSCLECSSNHSLDQCQKFKDKNVRERKEFVLRHKLCNVCLKANHVAKNCRSPRSCAVEGCGWRHHTLLHELREEPRNTNIDAHINTQLCTEKSVESVQKQAAFAIVPVLVRSGEKVAQTCAFLDSGSDASLITEDLAKRLNLEGEPKTISLKTLDNHSTIQCKEVQLEVSSLDSSSSFRIPNVWTVERLPMLRRTVPTTSQMKSWTHLKDISFPRVEDENVELLIGCNAPSVHEMKEVRTGKPNEPFAVKTPLGWTLFGSYGEPCKSNRVLNHLSAKEELEDKFGQLYSTEFKDPFSRTISMSVEDRIALSAISHSVQRLNGHYQIALPWRHNHKLPNNRRNVLSHVASIFDPIGSVAPIILPAKVILQDTCRQKLDWDAELPVDCQTKWNNWCRHIKGLDHLRISRCLKPGFEPSSAQIHCFPDASELAYGVVAYIRYKSVFGQIHCSFLLAKSRVAPLKLVTIPRMELTACVLCAKIGRHVREQLSIPISSVIYWTDSTVVLHCIRNTTKRFERFVSNRLETIHELSTPSQWRYVKGKLNPADHASRGLSLNDKAKVREWLQGPRFLWEEENKWPNLEKIENTIAHVLTEDFGLPRHDDEFLDRFRTCKSWSRLLRVFSYCRRFINNMLNKRNGNRLTLGALSAEDIENSKSDIIKLVQSVAYPTEKRILNSSLLTLGENAFRQQKGQEAMDEVNRRKKLIRQSSIRNLNPFMFEGKIRVGGRLQLSCLPFETKYPIILPNNHFVTDMIIMRYHVINAHVGVTQTLSSIREKYWIVRGYSTVRKVLKRCYLCRRLYPKPCSQLMAPLPEYRVETHSPPFSQVGVDYFGPFYAKRGRVVEKRYGCLFTCLSIRAVHIEMAYSLDTDSFLCALSRFIARRGCPKRIFSDNGTNFRGADVSLRQIIRSWNTNKIENHLKERECEWRFNPPRASHRGGVWERIIRSIRRILRVLLFQNVLTDETLQTFLTEAERILNDRPLVKMTDDPGTLEALTPNKLLLIHKKLSFDDASVDKTLLYNKRWKEAQRLTTAFWNRWIKEYLPTLQARDKWLDLHKNLQPGDLVLVSNVEMNRGLWPKAIVEQVSYGPDGRVRTAKLRTSNEEIVRDVRSLCLLEEAGCLTATTALDNGRGARFGGSVKCDR
ncbi:unnamed protein product [Schistosoma bovis]|nr:unnamed protein product [Schistosoma bovis]